MSNLKKDEVIYLQEINEFVLDFFRTFECGKDDVNRLMELHKNVQVYQELLPKDLWFLVFSCLIDIIDPLVFDKEQAFSNLESSYYRDTVLVINRKEFATEYLENFKQVAAMAYAQWSRFYFLILNG